MPQIDAHVFDITRLIQLAVAPVFLLTAIGTIINALTGRLGRAVDRRRTVEELYAAYEGDTRRQMDDELVMLNQRIRYTLWSIALAVLSALLICLLIGVTFVGAFVTYDLSKPVAALFILSMAALTGSLVLFLREVWVAALSVRHPLFQLRAALVRNQATAEKK